MEASMEMQITNGAAALAAAMIGPVSASTSKLPDKLIAAVRVVGRRIRSTFASLQESWRAGAVRSYQIRRQLEAEKQRQGLYLPPTWPHDRRNPWLDRPRFFY